MANYLYKTERKEDTSHIINQHFEREKEVPIYGKNVIYKLWVQQEEPIDVGWHVTSYNLLNALTEGAGTYDSHRLIIDIEPKSKKGINLVEILDIYGYTFKNGYIILMLRLREILYCEFDTEKTQKEVDDMKKKFYIKNPKNDPAEDIFEFIYLKGDKGWQPGKVGFVNAAVIPKEARTYFKQFFCK